MQPRTTVTDAGKTVLFQKSGVILPNPPYQIDRIMALVSPYKLAKTGLFLQLGGPGVFWYALCIIEAREERHKQRLFVD